MLSRDHNRLTSAEACYARFGLLLIISSGLVFVFVHNRSNEAGYQTYIDVEILKAKPTRTKEEDLRLNVLQDRQRIDHEDRDFYLHVLDFAIGAGIVVMVSGFIAWHYRVQRDLDLMTRLQIEKLQLEVKVLRRVKR